MLATKIAARLRTTERRRTPAREALSDVELGLVLLTTVYLLLRPRAASTSPVYPLVYALVSFLVTFHRLAVGLPLAAAAIGLEAVLAFGPAAAPAARGGLPRARRLHRASSRCSTSSSCTPRWRASAASTAAASKTRWPRCARRRATSA